MSAISIVLIAIVALLAGMEGILDEFQFHQPLVACTLIGLVTGHLKEGIILGGSLQMIALGWANVGAAVAPDAALASVASAIIMVLGLQGGSTNVTNAINTSIAVAVPLSVAGLFLTMICRTLAIPMVHFMDGAAEKGDYKAIERWQVAAILMQGLRIMIPAVILCFVPAKVVTGALNSMPAWLSGGMAPRTFQSGIPFLSPVIISVRQALLLLRKLHLPLLMVLHIARLLLRLVCTLMISQAVSPSSGMHITTFWKRLLSSALPAAYGLRL